jgi:long-chain acyl-CoA synthetase
MTLTERLKEISLKYPGKIALMHKNDEGEFSKITHKEFYSMVQTLGAGLASAGIKRGDHVGIISDNRYEWIITDLALLGLGAADVPRGSDTSGLEISFILNHADCKITFAENIHQAERILKYKDNLPLLEKIILIEGDEKAVSGIDAKGVEFDFYNNIFEAGKKVLADYPSLFEDELSKGDEFDLATIIYTSGTTGNPKGVLLTHRNFLFQLDRIKGEYIIIKPGDIMISILPVWHSFERTCEYVFLEAGGGLAYSQPIGSVLLPDMAKVKPQFIVSVPRVWEGIRNAIFRKLKKASPVKRGMFFFFLAVSEISEKLKAFLRGTIPEFKKRSRIFDITVSIIPYILLIPFNFLGHLIVFSKFKKLFGGKLTLGISGGGALPAHVGRFFNSVGIKINEGYGLTETAPVLAVSKHKRPVYGTVGQLLPDVEFKILDKEMNPVAPGEKGVLFVKSPQIMKGYYKNEEETEKVLKNGWLNTGDITIATVNREIKIVGREKETIVLSGGENVEPVPIEDKCLESEYIEQIIVLGQDMKYLAALIVPNFELIEQKASEIEIPYMDKEDLLSNPEIQDMVENEIKMRIIEKNGFRHFDKIFRFKLLIRPFEEGKELTQTMKLKRKVINDEYKKDIKKLFE